MIKKWIQRFYLVLIILFLYAPIVTLMVLSFNNSRTSVKWGGFSLKWYEKLFQNETILAALGNTLLIALLSAAIATLLGTSAAIAIHHMKKRRQSICMSIANIPMLNAEIVTGIAFMLLFITVGDLLAMFGIEFKMGFGTVLIGHITFNIPYVILSVMPKLKQFNRSMYEAALDLGARESQAFFRIMLPDIMPGVLSGFLLSFTMSLDDFVITHFVKGLGADTLSTLIYSELRKGIKPEMYALSTLMFLAVFIILLIVNLNPREKSRTNKQERIGVSL
ncbi:MAG: ABC transporter permease [Clostridiales bacterium]|nr:ABC transporter permease [Clostridiales bacterium]